MIPQGWQEKTLGKVCIVERGSSPRPIKNFITDDGSGVNWIKIGDCSGKYVTSTAQKITEEGAKKSRYVKKGDFVISNSMSYGKPYILKIDGYIHDGWFVLRLNKNLVNADYFYYLLSSNYIKEQYDALATGAIVQNISSDLIKRVQFNLPPLSEQERIVAKLDKAFEAIDKAKTIAETNLKNAKELFETALNNAFKKTDNIEQLKLDDIAEITSSKRIYKNEYTPLGIPFYRTKEIKELAHNLPISLELYISADKYMEIKNKFGVPSQNDLLISAVGTIGEIYIVQANDKFYFKDGNIIWFKKYKKEINVEYLKYCLTAFVKEIQNMTQGAAYNALTIEKLKEYKINIVNLTEQNEIVRKIKSIRDNIAKLEAIYTKKIKDLDELKQSILQKAFRGEL